MAVMLADDYGAVLLVLANAAVPEGAVRAMSAPLKAVVHFAGGLLLQPAALGAFFTRRTDGFALLHLDLKSFDAKLAFFLRRRLRGADELATFGLRLSQF